jgi:Tol biopolymer transport system component
MHDGGQSSRLESWKQIAAYPNKSERTVRRWHEAEGLPVHKHQHQQKGSVWAYPEELQQWLTSRTVKPETPPPAAQASSRWPWFMVAGIAVLGLVVLLLIRPRPRNSEPDPTPITTLPGSEYGASVSPDGKRIAFYWDQPSGVEKGIYTKEIDNSAVVPMAVAPAKQGFFYSPAWSPDGKTIAFLDRARAETWLCLVPSSGGQVLRLKQIAAAPALYFGNHRHISWSRDGGSIIVPMDLGSHQGIYRISPDTGSTAVITKDNLVYAPALSPDGRRLVSLRHEGLPIMSEEILLHELNPDGSVARGPVVLHKGHSASSGITWLADNKNLVLCKSESVMVGAISHLFQFPAVAGAEMKEIGGAGCNTVTLAPDGSLIYGATTTRRSRMLRVKLQPLEPAEDFLASSRFDTFPSFSPDGKQVAFNSTRSGKAEIWVAQQNGTALRRVAEGITAYSGAEWSPSGDRIVYVSGKSLTISDLSGKNPQSIDLAGTVAQHAVWSADGKTIYYTARSNLWRVRPDGTEREMLRELPPIIELRRSPDGRHLYYLKPGKPFTLCRIPMDGGAEEIVQEELVVPSFSVGRRALYSVRAGMEVYAQPLSGGVPERVGKAVMPDSPPNASWDTRFAISPDGGSAIWVHSTAPEVDLAMQRFQTGR